MKNKKDKQKKKSVSLITVWKYYRIHMRGYVPHIIVVLISGIGTAIVSSYTPVLFKKIIDFFVNVPETITYGNIPHELKYLILMLGAVYIIGFILHRFLAYIPAYVESKVMERLRNFTLAQLFKHSMRFFSDTFSGGLVTKSSRYIESFESVFDTVAFSFTITLFTLISIFYFVTRENKWLSVVFLAWFAVYALFIYLFLDKKTRLDGEKAEKSSEASSALSDIISNIFTVKFFSQHKKELNTYGSISSEEGKARRKAWYFNSTTDAAYSLLSVFFELLGLYLVMIMWSKGLVSPGVVVLFVLYANRVSEIYWNISWHVRSFSKALTDAKEMVAIFEQDPEILDPVMPERVKIKSGVIKFNDVAFTYVNGQTVFKKFSLEIPSGQKVGIVGYSGSGKTTLTELLLRFMDVNNGSITIDGQDIRSIRQDDLRRHISYVPQDPVLFHRTIKENIMYARPSATMKEIITAAKQAHAHEFIMDLPNGYNTFVGERGIKLSGGQRQRIAIARVMLQETPILILDEATSSLDSISESAIQEAFIEAMKNRTTLVIAHRLSTVAHLDRIIVLDNGKIVEEGTHNNLIAKNGYYAELWEHQVIV